ncbi:MAG TPA: YihY/virulence factor BrkB family protein [Candidatus Acidoferrales bacterium]|nr:YihY/virulence factor BrkB family protein [Candidatus Acidoferrales bacterium]
MADAVALVRETFRQWRDFRLPLQAAGLAFYVALSLGPLLIIVIEIVGLFVGAQSAEHDILTPLRPFIGSHATGALRGLASTFMHRTSTVVPSGVSLVLLFLGAAGIFEQLKETLDAIWEVPMVPRGILHIARTKMVAVIGVAAAIALILLMVATTTLLASAAAELAKSSPWIVRSISAGIFILSLGVATLLFGFTFKVLPDTAVRWSDVWLGSALTALLFILGQLLLSFFMARSGLETAYGRATAMVVILVWLYYSAQIYLFGALLTRVYAAKAWKKNRGDLQSPPTNS